MERIDIRNEDLYGAQNPTITVIYHFYSNSYRTFRMY
jgi:hypothetical protein